MTDKKMFGFTLIISLVLMTACEKSSADIPKNIDSKDIQTYSQIVKEVYSADIPFADDGIFYTDPQAGKIIVGLKEENENTKELKKNLENALPNKVEFIKVKYSRSDLNKASNQIKTKVTQLKEAGIHFSSVGVSVSEQKVRFVFNEFDEKRFENEHEVKKIVEGLVTQEEKDMLDIIYDPGMINEM